MGSQKYHVGNGVFSEKLYEDILGTETTINGYRCKAIKLIADIDGTNSNLPLYSGTSDVYVTLGKDGEPKQIRIYKDHTAHLDIDWSHTHKNKTKMGGDGRTFEKGTVHVQEFNNGVRLSNNARYLSNYECIEYGDIIKHFAPNVKLK